MNLEMIRNTRMCSNAKPPIDHSIKYAQEAEISEQVAKFLKTGGKIKKIAGVGLVGVSKTYKQVNDSTYVAEAK